MFYVKPSTFVSGIFVVGIWKGGGNQYIQLAKVLYCKLPTNSKQLPAFLLEARPGFKLQSQTWAVSVLHCTIMSPRVACKLNQKDLFFSVKAAEALSASCCISLPRAGFESIATLVKTKLSYINLAWRSLEVIYLHTSKFLVH